MKLATEEEEEKGEEEESLPLLHALAPTEEMLRRRNLEWRGREIMPKQPPPPPPLLWGGLGGGALKLWCHPIFWRLDREHTCIVVPCTILGIGMKCVFFVGSAFLLSTFRCMDLKRQIRRIPGVFSYHFTSFRIFDRFGFS